MARGLRAERKPGYRALVWKWLWRRTIQILRQQDDGEVIPPPESESWGEFALHLDVLVARTARLAAPAFALTALAWWPTDLFVLRGDTHMQKVFALWRGGSIVMLLALYVSIAFWPFARRHAGWFSLPFVVGATGLCAAAVGELTGPQSPWLYYLYFIPTIPMVVPARLSQRFAHMAGIGLAIFIGFFGWHPRHLSDPWALDALVFLACILIFGVLGMVYAWMQLALGYFQRRRIAAYAGELRDLNATLDARVLEKTRELRALAEHLEVVREEERTYLARELHDALGQELSAARYALAGARRAHDRGAEGVPTLLSDTERMLEMASDTTRYLVNTLRPLVLEQLGLVAACEWLARQMSARAGATVHFEARGEDEGIDERLGLALYRVMQEALTNIVKHAAASRIDVSIEVSENELGLTVTDDGRGLPEELPKRQDGGGLGLVGMRERALALCGTLSIERPEVGGTRVRLRLPIPRAREVGGGDA